MIRNMIGFATGIVFGLGLAVSHMVNPGEVLDFLDFAGDWDPSLIIVMGVAVAVIFVAYRIAKGRSAPVFAELFRIPDKKAIMDPRLLAGRRCLARAGALSGIARVRVFHRSLISPRKRWCSSSLLWRVRRRRE